MKRFEIISAALIVAGIVLVFGAAGRADCSGLDGAVLLCAGLGILLMIVPVTVAAFIVERRTRR